MSYYSVPPRSIDKTILSTLSLRLVDRIASSDLEIVEAAAVAGDTTGFTHIETDVKLSFPYVISRVDGMVAIVSRSAFEVTIDDIDTGDSVNFQIDKIFLFHGKPSGNVTLTVLAKDDTPVSVSISFVASRV